MSKAVLISIRPKYVEKICDKSKQIEVRKTRPKIETPFRCYIYCTRSKGNLFWLDEEIKDIDGLPKGLRAYNSRIGNGSVIGEFTCDKVLEWKYLNGLNDENEKEYWIISADGHATCLTYEEIENYGKGKTLYGWHISDLKVYDKPRDLSEFKRACPDNVYSCAMCRHGDYTGMKCTPITRPPQSYMFVEEN